MHAYLVLAIANKQEAMNTHISMILIAAINFKMCGKLTGIFNVFVK